MMKDSPCPTGPDPQLVGDPVDTLTGAVVDSMLDFRLTGPIELRWIRHYDSSQCHRSFSVGRGCAHEFDRNLSRDAEGLLYEEPTRRVLRFPLLCNDGDECAFHGFRVRRVDAACYLMFSHAEPTMEFVFPLDSNRARLTRLVRDSFEVRFFYDDGQRLIGIVDSAGRRLTAIDDEAGRLTRLAVEATAAKAGFLLIAYRYDEHGNLIATENDQGHGYAFAYDEANRMVLRRGRKGFQFYFKYDTQGRCIRSMGDERLYGVALDYKVPGRLTKVTRPDRGIWTYRFTPRGELQEILDPLGGVRKFIRDATGRQALEADPNGNVTRYVYDFAGAAVAKIDPLGYRISLPDDPDTSDPLYHRVAENAAEYEFGRLLDITKITLPDKAEVQEWAFPTGVSRLVCVRPEQPRATDLEPRFDVPPLHILWWPAPKYGRSFSDLGKLLHQRDLFGRMRRWSYDASGNVAEYFDFDGGRWTYDYGAWHLLRGLANPLGAEIRFSYTTNGEVASCTDAGGTHSEYRYDLKDQLVEVRRHESVRETYVRDPAGNLIAKYAADGRLLLSIEVGQGNLPVRRTFGSGDEHRLRYDAAGRLISATTLRDHFTMAYDRLNNQTSDQRNGLGVELRFGAADRPTRQVYFGRFQTRFERRSDASVALIDPGGKRHLLITRTDGVVERRFANASAEYAQYDPAGRCLFKHTIRGVGRPWTRQYGWSGEGELLSVTDSVAGVVSHEYDAAHRLVRRKTGGRTEEYRMDLANNLLAQPGLTGVSLSPGNRLAAANGECFTYDDRHHIILREKGDRFVRYSYDSRDQLVSAELPGGLWQAEYDVFGRRVRKHWKGRTTEYYWNRDQLAAELGPRNRVRLYIYADPMALTPILLLDYASLTATTSDCRRYIVFSNQLGTPCLIEDEKHEIVWRAEITPFGWAEFQADPDFECNLRWPGHYFDAETRLHYNRFRYYDPLLGRYLQSDPWGIAGGPNLYAYFTNPLAAVDVRGLGDESGKPSKTAVDEESTSPPTLTREGHGEELPSAFPNLERGGGSTNAHADRVVAAVQNTKPPVKQNRSVTVIEHQGGTVSVGISGGDPKRAADAQRVVDHLNTTHPSDPPTYRTTNGPVDASGLNDPGSKANPSPLPGTCSEPQAAQAAGTSSLPPESYQTVWTGPKECPPEHQLPGRPTTPAGNEQMKPCPTCQNNADNYTNASSAGSSGAAAPQSAE